MATYNDLATAYANQKKAEYEKSLSYLTTDAQNANNAAIQAINTQYDNLVNQINNQKTDVYNAYDENSQQAYVNKLLAGRQLNNTLSQLGIQTTGAGVQAYNDNEIAYGKNLGLLQKTRDEGLRNIANQVTESEGKRQVALQQQNADYLNTLASINQKKQAMIDDYYNKEYANYLADLQYQDSLAMQQYKTYYGGGGGGSQYASGTVPYGELADAYGDGKGYVIYTDTSGNQYKMKQGYNPYTGTKNTQGDGKGWFSNGYQPNNINGVPLKSSGVTVSYNGQNQTVWKSKQDSKNVYYVWDGTKNKYLKLNSAEKKDLGLK